MEQIFSYIGQLIVAGGGAALISLGLFQWLSKSWIQSKFAERLEEFRHEKAKELSRLKVEIDAALNSKIALQTKDLQVVSEAWFLANKAQGLANDYLAPMQSIPQIKKFDGTFLREHLEEFDFLPREIEEIIVADDRQARFEQALIWSRYNIAANAANDYRNFIFSNMIFLEEKEFGRFREISNSILAANSKFAIAKRANDPGLISQASNSIASLSNELDSLSRAIRTRLRSSETF